MVTGMVTDAIDAAVSPALVFKAFARRSAIRKCCVTSASRLSVVKSSLFSNGPAAQNYAHPDGGGTDDANWRQGRFQQKIKSVRSF